jgi:hypothetical protein
MCTGPISSKQWNSNIEEPSWCHHEIQAIFTRGPSINEEANTTENGWLVLMSTGPISSKQWNSMNILNIEEPSWCHTEIQAICTQGPSPSIPEEANTTENGWLVLMSTGPSVQNSGTPVPCV